MATTAAVAVDATNPTAVATGAVVATVHTGDLPRYYAQGGTDAVAGDVAVVVATVAVLAVAAAAGACHCLVGWSRPSAKRHYCSF